ncbi:MAG: T9SS type A sorting domain-containing protein [Ignavibacteriae bacterium]|nr:T9SS type A sorting domain-containing protein [Ignavibacteriota bacterium]
MIQPGNFLLVWADKDTTQGSLHANFRISADGEQIGLAKQTDNGFIFIDTLTFGNQTSDVSYGRIPDGGNEFQFFVPTPGYKNILTDIVFEESKLPKISLLNQNYPNPFNPETTINYSIQTDRLVSLKVYNVLGKNVTTLVNQKQRKGNYKITFNGSQLPSGVYIYRIQCNSFVDSKKMILMK